MTRDRKPKPRNGFNLTLTFGLAGSAAFLLWVASSTDDLFVTILAAILFSYILLVNYFLLHEGSHNNQHSNSSINQVLGTISGWLFPISFTFYTRVHLFHHQKNRTEHENFEYYFAGESRWLTIFRHLQWYSIMIGTYWLLPPLASALCAISPRPLRSRLIRLIPSWDTLFDKIDKQAIRNIRLEMLSGILFWYTVWTLLDLSMVAVVICYACFAFNWSSRQYVAHAFAPLDHKHGAHNLKHHALNNWLYLNSGLHLTHHQHPDVPWHLLPEYVGSEPLIPYWQQYLRLWGAPRLWDSTRENAH